MTSFLLSGYLYPLSPLLLGLLVPCKLRSILSLVRALSSTVSFVRSWAFAISKCWVERDWFSEKKSANQSLEHMWQVKNLVQHLLRLEVRLPRWVYKLVEGHRKVYESFDLATEREKIKLVKMGKVIERNLARAWPLMVFRGFLNK